MHKAAYMQVVVITYDKAKWYSLELSHIIKRKWYSLGLSHIIKSNCILYYYMTIDIHKAIGNYR